MQESGARPRAYPRRVSHGLDDGDTEMRVFREAEQDAMTAGDCLRRYAACPFDLFALEDWTSQEKS